MTYLELCKRLRQEAGLSGTGPTTAISQTGEMLRVVEWIDAAYESIQSYHATWRFLRSDFSFSTIDGTQAYSPADVSITDLATWIEEDIRVYSSVADESYLQYELWRTFRAVYLYGAYRSQEARPTTVSIKPDNSIIFYPTPDAVYTIDGEYFKTPDAMALDADEPNFPARFHMAVVWRALMLYGAYAAADEKYAHGEKEYNRIFSELQRDQIDQISYGAPLA